MAQWGLLREPDDTHLTPRVYVKVGGENWLRYECTPHLAHVQQQQR